MAPPPPAVSPASASGATELESNDESDALSVETASAPPAEEAALPMNVHRCSSVTVLASTPPYAEWIAPPTPQPTWRVDTHPPGWEGLVAELVPKKESVTTSGCGARLASGTSVPSGCSTCAAYGPL